ncbi:hypothetical protein KSS87_002777, partial [Heliosperma pusillum]
MYNILGLGKGILLGLERAICKKKNELQIKMIECVSGTEMNTELMNKVRELWSLYCVK